MIAPLALMGASMATDLVGGVVQSLTSASKAASAKAPKSPDKLHKAASEFESVFLEQSFGHLTENTGPDGPLGAGGTGGSVYRSMLMKEYAGSVVKSGGVGIADSVYRQLLKMQEGSGAAPAS